MQIAADQLLTLHQYISCIFGDIEPLQISAQDLSNNRQKACVCLVSLALGYGKMIMKLSDQSTLKYRKDNFLNRKEVEQEIAIIYKIVVGQEPAAGYDTNIRIIIEKLQQQRKSNYLKQSLPQSRILESAVKKSATRQLANLQEQRNSNSRPSSRVKTKTKKQTSVKQVLQIRNYLESQENALKQFFQKINTMLYQSNISKPNLSSQTLSYDKPEEENSQNMVNFIENFSQNFNKNIEKLCRITQVMHKNYQKKIKNQLLAQTKLNIVFTQIKKTEEVYSYTLSKMLQKIGTIKSFKQESPSVYRSHIQNLEEIIKKLYGLYPNKQSLNQMTANVRSSSDQSRNFGVQVNMGKAQTDKRLNLETFRFQTRVNQYLERFQKNIKFRKNLQAKQIQKFIQSLRDLLPTQHTYSQSQNNYKQELKKMLDIQQKNYQESIEAVNKKNKKLQKRIAQLEKQILQQNQRHRKQCEDFKQQTKKLQRKIQNTNADYSKLMNQKSALQGSISVMIKQIQQMKQQVKRQSEDQFEVRNNFQLQQSKMKSQLQKAQQKKVQCQAELKRQKERIFQERGIYQQKIQFMEDVITKQKEASARLSIQNQNLLTQRSELQQQLVKLQQIHEQKILAIEQMKATIKQLSRQRTKYQSVISELSQAIKGSSQKLQDFEKNLVNQQIRNKQLINQNNKIAKQLDHWKEERRLTDSDLKILRDQVDKVNQAYIELEEQFQSAKKQLSVRSEEKENVFRQKLKLTRVVEDLQSQNHGLRIKLQALQLAERDTKDEYYQKCQQILRQTKQLEDLKKEISSIKKELYQEREERAALQKQSREIRQQLQRKKQGEKTEQSKRKIQSQELKVQIRRKTEQLEKQREGYQQKLSLLNHKIKQMQGWMSQKQMLSRLMQSNQTQ